jgi:hypothetical protein
LGSIYAPPSYNANLEFIYNLMSMCIRINYIYYKCFSDSVLSDEEGDSIASRMKRRRNQQLDDDEDENNSYKY